MTDQREAIPVTAEPKARTCATKDLCVGDRVQVGGAFGIPAYVRTVARVYDTGMVNRYGQPILGVDYSESEFVQRFKGNCAAANSLWKLIN